MRRFDSERAEKNEKSRKGEVPTGLARALSKLGFCSRSQACELIAAGRVRVNGVTRHDPQWRVRLRRDRIDVDRHGVEMAEKVYLMLHKPRGLVTSAADERGRATVFECLADAPWPFVSPIGRLDQDSEGLLLFTNDTAWAACLTAPESHIDKVYHVQIDCRADDALVRRLCGGARSRGDFLAAKRVRPLRDEGKTSWLEIVLDEGKNRHIRRLLDAFGVKVRRLVRVAIGPLRLGELRRGQWRLLTPAEIQALAGSTPGRLDLPARSASSSANPAGEPIS